MGDKETVSLQDEDWYLLSRSPTASIVNAVRWGVKIISAGSKQRIHQKLIFLKKDDSFSSSTRNLQIPAESKKTNKALRLRYFHD